MRFLTALIPVVIVGGLIAGVFLWVRRSGANRAATNPSADVQPRRISLLAEAIGYIGAILVLAGGGAAIGQRWDEMSETFRIGVIGAAAVGFLVAGVAARRSGEPAFRRLTSVVWLVSTVGVGVTAALIATWTYDLEERAVVTAAAFAATVYATILWRFNRGALQHLALFAAGLVLVSSSVAWTSQEPPGWTFALAWWVYGAGWAIGGWRRLLEPWWAGVPLGTITALIAPTAIEQDGGVYGLGLVTAGSIMALAVGLRFPPGLAIGAVGLFAYVTGGVVRYFGEALGVPTALALTGVAILAVAVVTARLMGYAKRSPPEERTEKPTLRKVS
ncbi:MAG: hypothetical protein WEB06_10820 [Actinomycetota bacterium]